MNQKKIGTAGILENLLSDKNVKDISKKGPVEICFYYKNRRKLKKLFSEFCQYNIRAEEVFYIKFNNQTKRREDKKSGEISLTPTDGLSRELIVSYIARNFQKEI